jgi:hypothetical protein
LVGWTEESEKLFAHPSQTRGCGGIAGGGIAHGFLELVRHVRSNVCYH